VEELIPAFKKSLMITKELTLKDYSNNTVESWIKVFDHFNIQRD
jgi:hypothetical protein